MRYKKVAIIFCLKDFVGFKKMDKPQLKRKQPTVRMVVEFPGQSPVVLPEDITLFCMRWLESMTSNGFSNVRITSEMGKHQIIMQMEAGSILRGTLAIQRAEVLNQALQNYRVTTLGRLNSKRV